MSERTDAFARDRAMASPPDQIEARASAHHDELVHLRAALASRDRRIEALRSEIIVFGRATDSSTLRESALAVLLNDSDEAAKAGGGA